MTAMFHDSYSADDEEYLDAVERGDMARAQDMVDEAARAKGYDYINLFHGTGSFGFTEFDLAKMDDSISIFTTSNENVAMTYSGGVGARTIGKRSFM